MTKHTPAKTPKPLTKAYIVFGADECARPRAARFWARHVEPLAEAAAAMNVRLVQVSDPRLAALMPAIPPGRLHASGREFLPHISGDTYAELAAAVLIRQPSNHPAATDEALPYTWNEVVPGRLVLARETRECGWWEAVVVDRHRDRLTLRYRDYPDHPNFVRGPSAVALIAAPEFGSRALGHGLQCRTTVGIRDLGINSQQREFPTRASGTIGDSRPDSETQTMTEPTLTCPTCQTEIKLTESLAAPLIEVTRRRFEDQLARKEAEVAGREAAIRDQQVQIAAARDAIEAQVAAKVDEERSRIAAAEAQKAKRLVAIDVDAKVKEIADLNQVLKQRDAKLAEAQQAQADLIRKQRELDDAKREMDLTIQKQVQAALGAVRDQAKQETEAALTLRVREKEEQIASMQRQIEDLRRKAEQGSQQLQGEVQELALEALLRQKFPRDAFDPVPKGEFGGDLIQHVVGPAGQICGSILWEAKRTKNWADAWLGKLREDQRAAKADMALIVSHALPKGLQTFDHIDGVWVTEPRCAVAVAIALRESLIALASARLAGEGQQTKMELVYQYLTGPRFRHRIEAVVERFSDMQADLDRQRKTMMRLWAKREEQIRSVVESTAGLYGDLQGIAGRSLLEIDGLEMPLLDGPAGIEAAE